MPEDRQQLSLKMRTVGALVLGFSALAAVGSCSAVETAQAEAMSGCQLKAVELFPVFARAFAARREAFAGREAEASVENSQSDDPKLEAMVIGLPMEFRFVSTGQFLTYGNEAGDVPLKLACSGDFNQRRLTSVQFNGAIRRPPAGAEWSF